MNRLSGSKSLYLRQHAEDPVHWQPWGDEAFTRARLEQKPVLVSIGYSACHWCHVMHHESFQNPAVASVLNSHFISVKVDREQHPDVDDLFMSAVQVAMGSGGWPITAFATPDRLPFFAATYLPPEGVGEVPGFLDVLQQVAAGWVTRRSEFEEAAKQYGEILRQLRARLAPPPRITFDQVGDLAIAALAQSYDHDFGGFGDHPKFPAHAAVNFLLTLFMASRVAGWPQSDVMDSVSEMGLMTMAAMSSYTICDQVGGGYHRYATDRQWRVPHFEKMLTDNAWVLRNLVLIRAITKSGLEMPRLIRWVEEEMTAPDGTFYTSVDADSEGEEGLFYTWTEEEIRTVLGAEADVFIEVFGIQPDGNYFDEATRQKNGRNVISRVRMDLRLTESLDMLKAARDGRPRPAVDHAAVGHGNGLMIRALAEAGEQDKAARCARAWMKAHSTLGFLPHILYDGDPEGRGQLDDYAAIVYGLFALGDEWRAAALDLLSEARDMFSAPSGGWYATSSTHELLVARQRPWMDSSSMSGNALIGLCLLEAGFVGEAKALAESGLGWFSAHPEGFMGVARLWLGLDLAPVPAEESQPEPVVEATPPPAIAVRLPERDLVAEADGWARTVLHVSIPEGWHINTNNPPARWMEPTIVSAEGVEVEIDYPASPDVLTGDLEFNLRLRPLRGASEAEGELTLRFQACTDQACLEPAERRFDLRVRQAER